MGCLLKKYPFPVVLVKGTRAVRLASTAHYISMGWALWIAGHCIGAASALHLCVSNGAGQREQRRAHVYTCILQKTRRLHLPRVPLWNDWQRGSAEAVLVC